MAVVELDGEPPGFGEPGYEPFDDLWSRLARPFETIPVVAAVVGLPPRAVDPTRRAHGVDLAGGT